MNASRLATLITLVLAFVSCVAAVLVVPEFRCAVGLETSIPRQCGPRKASAQDVASQFTTPRYGSAAASERAAVESAVLRIRARFQQVERDVEAGRLGSGRKEIVGMPGDSAYATVYFAAAEIPKVRARIFENGNRTAYQAYYEGGELVFMFRTVDRLLPSGPQRLEEQRYYFDHGRMVRWLSPGGEVPGGSAEYVAAERQVRALGAALLAGAHSSDAAISL